MSIDTEYRPAPAPFEPEPRKRGLTLLPARSSKSAAMIVGGPPRANLLPPEVILKRKQLKTRRALRFGVLLVAIGVIAGCVVTFGVSSVAQVQLSLAQQTQQALIAEQAKYSEVRQVQDTIKAVIAGQQVGDSTEIDWREYLVALQGTLPAGVTLDTVTIESATPMTAFAQSDAPLQGARVASLDFSAKSATLPTIPEWLRSMAKLDGFVDAIPGSVKFQDGVYTAQVLMHINTDAFSHRLDPNVAKKDTTTDTTTDTEGQ